MASGILTWLMVAVPVGLCLALWGFGMRRNAYSVGRWLMIWGFVGPYLVPVAVVVTWLVAGESAPNSGHEPWPWYAAAAFYSVVVTLVVAGALVLAGWASMIARIGLRENPD